MSELRPCPKPAPSRKRAPKRLQNRGGSRFEGQRDRSYTRWLRTENRCFLLGRFLTRSLSPRDMLIGQGFMHFCWGRREAAHVNQTRAQGAPDFGETIPACKAVHSWLDSHTREDFYRATGVRQSELTSLAAGFALRFVERGGTPVTIKELRSLAGARAPGWTP